MPPILTLPTMKNNYYEPRRYQVNEVVSARHTRERRSLWAEKWDSIKDGFAEMYHTSTFFNLFCCTVPEDHLEYKLDQMDRLAVREALMQSLDYNGHKSIISAVMDDISEHEGYEMRMHPPAPPVVVPPPAAAVPTIVELVRQVRAACAAAKETRLVVWVPPEVKPPANEPPVPCAPAVVDSTNGVQGVRSVPRFTAAVVVALRSKLGQLNPSVQGNELVLEREALRLMRDYNVREVHRVVHLPRIIAAYWSADVHYRVPTVESRMTRFQRWLLNRPAHQPQFAVPRA